MKLELIHHNVRNWGYEKYQLANYYLKHNPDVITINSYRPDPAAGQFLKIYRYLTKLLVLAFMQGLPYSPIITFHTKTIALEQISTHSTQ